MSDAVVEPVTLSGLDAANPLAFLAALGVLRVLTLASAALRPCMAWRIASGAWRPALYLSEPLVEAAVAGRVFDVCQRFKCDDALTLGDDLAIDAATYRQFVLVAAAGAQSGELFHAQFAASFATEVLANENGNIQDTALRTMSGAGHQHFLRTMRNLVADTTVEHVHRALFQAWDYDDPVRNMTLRWDPSDDNRYALRWSDPSGDPQRQHRGAMWGANRLAIEGLPLLPVMPTGRQLETTGFRTAGSRDTFWTWPVWEAALSLDAVRSLLALKELQAETPDRLQLSARGVAEVFRSQRLTVGKFRNFTWATPA